MRGQAVLVSGYASLDSFILVDHIRGLGETSSVLAFKGLDRPLPGGCACNIAMACARLGIGSLLITALGEDVEGITYKERLASAGIDTRFVCLVRGVASPRTVLVNDQDGGHLTFYYSGASDHLIEMMKGNLAELEGLDVRYSVITVGDPGFTRELVVLLHRRRVPILWAFKADMRAYPYHLLQLLLEVAEYLVVNEAEARLLCKLFALGDISALLDFGPKGVVVTKGSRGSEVITDVGRETIPSVQPCRMVDPTGAGDGFVAGVLYGLYHGKSLAVSARVGATLASFVLEEWGAQTALPGLAELKARYCKNFGSWPVEEGDQ
ncbi:MAG: carbohydrate kinase family protein [Candidatus Hadarchaeum sp.]|uniref:carbohydrate kinase family protein n=1 Tax=Candidatus Hadarchaeum sp. TaxID=2883567 RepID=UPI003D11729E